MNAYIESLDNLLFRIQFNVQIEVLLAKKVLSKMAWQAQEPYLFSLIQNVQERRREKRERIFKQIQRQYGAIK